MTSEVTPRRRPALALMLLLLAPLVGEFLLGNLPITWLWTIMALAPMYGCGAILVRDMARRYRLQWPAIVLLGFAYGMLEEAFVTGSLFNPNYLGLRLLDYGYLPALGIGTWWTVFVLSLHGIWSTAVPIAVVESFDRRWPPVPWLGPVGFFITAVAFVLGCVVTAGFQPAAETEATTGQLLASAAIIAGLVVAAFVFGGMRPIAKTSAAGQPSPQVPLAVGTLTFVGGSIFMGLAMLTEIIPASVNVAGMVLVLALLAVALLRWSRRPGWSMIHRLAAASGLMLTYVWYGFVQVPSVDGTSPSVDLIGNIIFSVSAVLLLAWAFYRMQVTQVENE